MPALLIATSNHNFLFNLRAPEKKYGIVAGIQLLAMEKVPSA